MIGQHVFDAETERGVDAVVSDEFSAIGVELGRPANRTRAADEAQLVRHRRSHDDACVRTARSIVEVDARWRLGRAFAEIVVAQLDPEVADELVAAKTFPGQSLVVAGRDWNPHPG